MTNAVQPNDLVLVIPTILELQGETIKVDRDFASNLKAYLNAFDHVSVYCPAAEWAGMFPDLCDIEDIPGFDRLTFHVLPKPHREDRYLRHRAAVKDLLTPALLKARYRLISPFAPLNWSTLAAGICLNHKLTYNFESDWDLPTTSRYIVRQMPFGTRKLHHRLRLEVYILHYRRLLRNSTLALVQGEDVYEAYKNRAPNVHTVLNVQITEKERIGEPELRKKLDEVADGQPLKLVYAGRASEMKGPMLWLDVMTTLKQRGVRFEATWLGGGELFDEMQQLVATRGLADVCKLPGNVSKDEVLRAMRGAHLFVFCHMGYESPRNLMEAVASGAPLCGFGTAYSEGLVKPHGGGEFVARGDTRALTDAVERLASDRAALGNLIARCARSGTELDRDKSIARRIDLMKAYL